MTTTLDSIVARATDLRHDIHRHPELGFQEKRTAQVIRSELDRLGIPWRASAGTGTVARLAERARGTKIGLRADIDCLPMQEQTGLPYASTIPNHMHACGHDGHTASLLATAAYFKSREAELPGPVTLLFQPAEEGGHGARKMVEEGAVEGLDEIYGYHNWPPLPFGTAAAPTGPIMAANAAWTATIIGHGGHGATPHLCIDPVLTGAQFITLVQQVVSRQIPAQRPAVVSTTCFHGGTADNIIPESVELVGTLRAANTTLRDELANRVETVLAGVCAAAGARYQFAYQPCYPATINHPGCAARMWDALRAELGENCLRNDDMPLMGAEDFSYFAEAKPACYVLLGSGRAGKTLESCHSPRFDFDDGLIPVATRLWARLAGLQVG